MWRTFSFFISLEQLLRGILSALGRTISFPRVSASFEMRSLGCQYFLSRLQILSQPLSQQET